MSLRDRLVCFGDFIGLNLLALLFLLPLPICLLRVCRPTIFVAVLKFFCTTNSIFNFWRIKFQQVSTYAFCSWDDIFKKKWNCSSPNNLCKLTESPSTLSTNTSMKWNLYLFRRNHLVKSFMVEMNVGGFSEHQNKTIDTITNKKTFSLLVSLKSMWILWKKVWAVVWSAGC